MIRHGCARGGYYIFWRHSAFRGESFLQRLVAVAAWAGDFQIVDGDAQSRQRKIGHATYGEVESGAAAELGPFHVRGSDFAPLGQLRLMPIGFSFSANSRKNIRERRQQG